MLYIQYIQDELDTGYPIFPMSYTDGIPIDQRDQTDECKFKKYALTSRTVRQSPVLCLSAAPPVCLLFEFIVIFLSFDHLVHQYVIVYKLVFTLFSYCSNNDGPGLPWPQLLAGRPHALRRGCRQR